MTTGIRRPDRDLVSVDAAIEHVRGREISTLDGAIREAIRYYLAALPADKPDAAREQEDFETLASSQSLNTSYGDYAAGQYDAPRTQLCWMFYQQGRSDARMATATPPPSIPPKTEAVRVKPLEWVEEIKDTWWTTDAYRIEVFDGGGFAARVARPQSRAFLTLAHGISFDEAKAAAQADYERRILSALASPEGE